MSGEQEKKAIEKGLLTLWIIWAGIIGSLIIYVFICHQIGDEMQRNMSHDIPLSLLRNIFYGIALITLLLCHFLKRHMLSGISRSSLSKSPEFSPLPKQPPFLAKYTTALVVAIFLSETIGIYGLVLFFLGDSFQTLYIFIGISALSIYFHRPKREEMEALALAMQTNETSPARR